MGKGKNKVQRKFQDLDRMSQSLWQPLVEHKTYEQFEQETYPTVKPQTLKEYESIYPRAPEIVFQAFEKSVEHTVAMEQKRENREDRILEIKYELSKKEKLYSFIVIALPTLIGALMLFLKEGKVYITIGVSFISVGALPILAQQIKTFFERSTPPKQNDKSK